jgi:diamine N-acetyltransferase
MGNVELREITRTNFRECAKLKPGEDQTNLVAANAYSIAEAKFKPGYEPYAIYQNEIMAGFIMFGHDKTEDKAGQYWIIRLMVAEGFQNQGIGGQATHLAIRKMLGYRDCEYISVGTGTMNSVAERFYLKCGFIKTGEVCGGETQFRYKETKPRGDANLNEVLM